MQRQEAEEHLRVIRSLMEKATVYRAISAPTALIAGLLAIGAAFAGGAIKRLLIDWQSEESRIATLAFPITWFAVLLLVGAANGYFLYRDAQRRGEKFISHGMKMALIALLPCHLTAAVLSVVVEPNPAMLALVWNIFHGLGLLATGHFSPRSIILLGWAFLAAGLGAFAAFIHLADGLGLIVAFTFVQFNLFSPHILMAITFGGFHLIYAACTWPRKSATH